MHISRLCKTLKSIKQAALHVASCDKEGSFMLIRFYFVCRLLFLAFFSELFGFFLCLVCGVLSLKSFNLGVSCLFSLCLTLFCLVIESLYLTEMLIVLLLIYKAFGVKIRLCGTVKVCVPIHSFLDISRACLRSLAVFLISARSI